MVTTEITMNLPFVIGPRLRRELLKMARRLEAERRVAISPARKREIRPQLALLYALLGGRR